LAREDYEKKIPEGVGLFDNGVKRKGGGKKGISLEKKKRKNHNGQHISENIKKGGRPKSGGDSKG